MKRTISDEEMALPTRRKPTKEELNKFLDRKQGKGIDLETVRKRVLGNYADKTETVALSALTDEIKKSEKSGRISWTKAKKEIASWK